MHRYQKSHKNPHLTRHISTSNTRHRPAKIIRGLLRYNPSGMALELGRNPCRRMCGWGNSIGINVSLFQDVLVFLSYSIFSFRSMCEG
jgi:hypothetical protein